MYLEKIDVAGSGLDNAQIQGFIAQTLEGRGVRRALLVPPDITRLHSGAGRIANICYHLLTQRGCSVDVLPAVGTHGQMDDAQREAMFGDIPGERFGTHDWRRDVVRLGVVPGDWLSGISEGAWDGDIAVEIDPRVMDPGYDLILSIGQVVPHEVVGMANHAKNLFVGLGGADMIDKSHMLGAAFGMERVMGRDHSPVRQLFDHALERFLKDRPILFVLTVVEVRDGAPALRGLFAGDTRRALESAIALSQRVNITYVPKLLKKCVVWLDPVEYRSTWLGNKAIYRTRMAMADGGELIILAPGIRSFGESPQADRLIRKYGYRGMAHTLDLLKSSGHRDLWDNLSTAAHLIHGSCDGRFRVTYAVRDIAPEAVAGVGYGACEYDAIVKRYDPAALHEGFNRLADGEEIYYIPNPGAGLWMTAPEGPNGADCRDGEGQA